VARVALLWSAPSVFWRRFSSLTIGAVFAPSGIPFFDYFSGVARIFEDSHTPYEVLVLGHPDVFNDTSSVSRFHEFETLVLSGVDALSDAHAADITSFVRAGGNLVAVGDDVGTLDEELARRNVSALQDLVKNPQPGAVSVINSSVMQAYIATKDASAATAVVAATRNPVKRPAGSATMLATTLPPSVRTNVFVHGAGPMVSVDFINYGA